MLVEVQIQGDAAAAALAEELIRATVGFKTTPLAGAWWAFRVDESAKRLLPPAGAFGVRYPDTARL